MTARFTGPLSGQEAVRRFKEDPESVFFTLSLFMLNFGLTWEELRAELASGRLPCMGWITADGVENPHITTKQYLEWLQNPETPIALIMKAEANSRTKSPSQQV